MTITLRPLRADEYDQWLAVSEDAYRGDMEEAGIAPDVAAAKTKRDHEALLRGGVETPGQFLFAILDDDRRVGVMWLAERDGQIGRSLFVYNVNVESEYRGRGIGRSAMRLVEEQARGRGIDTIELNVFGGNVVARGLYQSLGYEETAVTMRKHV